MKLTWNDRIWKACKALCGVGEGEQISKSGLLPRIAILLNRDRWFWKLYFIKNHRDPAARRAYETWVKNENFDWNRMMWKVGGLEIPDELIKYLGQKGIDWLMKLMQDEAQR